MSGSEVFNVGTGANIDSSLAGFARKISVNFDLDWQFTVYPTREVRARPRLRCCARRASRNRGARGNSPATPCLPRP